MGKNWNQLYHWNKKVKLIKKVKLNKKENIKKKRGLTILKKKYRISTITKNYNGLIFQDKFFTNFVSYFRLFFKLHFANNLGIHSSVFDNRYLNETFDNYIYSCNFQYRL